MNEDADCGESHRIAAMRGAFLHCRLHMSYRVCYTRRTVNPIPMCLYAHTLRQPPPNRQRVESYHSICMQTVRGVPLSRRRR